MSDITAHAQSAVGAAHDGIWRKRKSHSGAHDTKHSSTQPGDLHNGKAIRPVKKRSGTVTTVAAILIMVIGVLVLFYPLAAQMLSARTEAEVVSNYDEQAAALEKTKKQEMLASARDYNERLYTGDQGPLGIGNPASETDADYQNQLDVNGVMGSISIPKISVNIPIYHGTTDTVLAAGAGHLYGTSLPVGGKNTHAVIAAHRGLPQAMLFTRLDEMKKGDTFFITILGEELAYKVDKIMVVEPEDVSDFDIVPGKDMVTLLTCTPYGVNTQRLLVRGVRTDLSKAVVQGDTGIYPTGYFIGLEAAVVLVIAQIIRARQRRRCEPIAHHRR